MLEISEILKKAYSVKGVKLVKVLTDHDTQEKQEEIKKWLNFPYLIAELEHERVTFSQRYYQEHSFYSHVVYDDIRGVISEAPKVETLAIHLTDSCLVLDRRIKRLKEQYKLFSEWLARSPTNGKDTLKTTEIIQEIKRITETSSNEKKEKLLK